MGYVLARNIILLQFYLFIYIYMHVCIQDALNYSQWFYNLFVLAFAVVTLPSPHHRWSVSNLSVAQVDSMMGLTHAVNLGETSIIVEDTRVVGHRQVSSLNVVLPDTLCLYILPLSISGDLMEEAKAIPSVARWYVISGHQYLIQLKVFSQGPGAQEIYITEVTHDSSSLILLAINVTCIHM